MFCYVVVCCSIAYYSIAHSMVPCCVISNVYVYHSMYIMRNSMLYKCICISSVYKYTCMYIKCYIKCICIS